MTSLRDAIVANALWGADNEDEIHYSQGSHRFDALHTPRYLPLYTDCSAFVTLCYAWAGAPDPNGLGYNHTGYTGSLLLNLPAIDLGDAQPGDLIVYGPGPGDHVVVIIEPGADPLTVSHGQERGPFRVRHSVEARAHRAPFRVLRGLPVNEPTPAPDPQPPQRRRRHRMYVFQLESGDYRVWQGIDRWSPVSAEAALKIAEANGQTNIRTLPDADYANLGGH